MTRAWLKTTGLTLAASAPVWIAAAAVAVFARDLSEAAAAVLAGAAVVSLAGFGAVWLALRQANAQAATMAETRELALGLARCLRDMNQRLAGLESGDAAPETPEEDAPMRDVAEPDAAALRMTDAMPLPDVIANPAPAIVTRTIRRLNDGRAVALRLSGEAGAAAPFPALLAAVAAAGEAGPVALIDAPEDAEARLRAFAALLAAPNLCDRIVLLIDRLGVRNGGPAEAEGMAALARAGYRFALSGLDGLHIDGAALAACRIVHVRLPAALLAAEAPFGQLRRRAEIHALRGHGVEVIVDGVDQPETLHLMQMLGAPLGEGAALEPKEPETAPDTAPAAQARRLPWRAALPRLRAAE